MSLNSSLDRLDALNSDFEESVKRAEAIADALVGTSPEVATDSASKAGATYSLIAALDGRLDRYTDLGTRLRIALSRINDGVQGSDRIGGPTSTGMGTLSKASGY